MKHIARFLCSVSYLTEIISYFAKKTKKIVFSVEGRPTTRCVYLVTLVWPWPWSRDLHTRPWPRFTKTYLPIKSEVFGWRLSEVRARTGQRDRQTDRHTDGLDWKYYHSAFTGASDNFAVVSFTILCENLLQHSQCNMSRNRRSISSLVIAPNRQHRLAPVVSIISISTHASTWRSPWHYACDRLPAVQTLPPDINPLHAF